MSASTLEDLSSFHRFLTARLQSQPPQTSPEDCLLEWRASQADREATLDAAREGLSDIAAGRVQSLAEFDGEFRERHNLARVS